MLDVQNYVRTLVNKNTIANLYLYMYIYNIYRYYLIPYR